MKLSAVLIIFTLCFSSSLKAQNSTNGDYSKEEVEKEVTETFNKLYEEYSKFDLEGFTQYYQDDVIRMGKDGTVQRGKDIFKRGWRETAEKYDMVLLDYSQPEVLVAEDQVVTYNTYHELFISKETRDTTVINGTWIGIWKRQEDNSWKLRMTTWH